MAEYIIANGETLSNQYFGYGDTILVQTGGTLNGAVIPYNVSSVTLEAGAALSGTIRTAKEITLSGSGAVDASGADLILDISDRKPENDLGIMISDLTLLAANSLSVVVDPDQDKGTYRLVGNAADFTGTISIMDSFGESLGTLSVGDSSLDYEFAHYALSLNESDELCLTVSSNLPDQNDYVLLYKDNELYRTYPSTNPLPASLTISSADNVDGDTLYVLKNGIADDITLGEGGTLHYHSGATVTDLYLQETINQGCPSTSLLHATFDGNEESGLLTGTHQLDDFSYQNKVLTNMAVLRNSEVVVKNGVTVNGLYIDPDAIITIDSGSTVTGNIREYNGIGDNWSLPIYLSLRESAIDNARIYESRHGITVGAQNSTINNLTVIPFDPVLEYAACEITIYQSTVTNSVVNGLRCLNNNVYGGQNRLGNVTVDTLANYSNVILTGDLVVKNMICGSGSIDADNHAITLDMTQRTVSDDFMIRDRTDFRNISKYNLLLRGAMPGRYHIAQYVDSLTDTYDICLSTAPDTIIGSLSRANNWTFTPLPSSFNTAPSILNLA